jgi:hypothetical protein
VKRLVCLVALPVLSVLATLISTARAAEQQIRTCEFAVKSRCVSGEARVTVANGVVIRIEINADWCGLPGHPGFICTIDSSRSDQGSTWSDDRGTTLITNASPWNPHEPDQIKVTVGPDVSVDLTEAQSLGRCGARNCRAP